MLNEQTIRLRATILDYKTELLLKRAMIYDEATAPLIGQPDDLIAHIYTHHTDWDDLIDRGFFVYLETCPSEKDETRLGVGRYLRQ